MTQASDPDEHRPASKKDAPPGKVALGVWVTTAAGLAAIGTLVGVRMTRTPPAAQVVSNGDPAADQEPEKKPEKEPEKTPPGVWVAVSAAIAAALGIFTALGIEGETLRRMVRNAPDDTAQGMTLIIVGAAITVIPLLSQPLVSLWPKAVWLIVASSAVSGLLVVAGMGMLVSTGAFSLNAREAPSLSLKAVKLPSGVVTIDSEAVAPSLRNRERMILRIYGVGPSETAQPYDFCNSDSKPEASVAGSRVLKWGESGPDKTGSAKISESLVLTSTEFRFVCAYTALEGEVGSPYTDRWAVSMLDLSSLAVLPPEPAQPRPIPSVAQ